MHSRRLIGLSIALASAAALAFVLLRPPETTYTSGSSHSIGSTASSSPEIRLSGVIYDLDRRSIEGLVCVYESHDTAMLQRACAPTDTKGRFAIELSSGEYWVTASSSEHSSASEKVSIAGQSVHRDFILRREAPTLAGRVASASGEPLARAEVTVFKGSDVIANLVTDAQGQFRATTSLGELMVRAESPGFGAGTVHTLAPTMDISITLFPGNMVDGYVALGDSGQRVAGARVVAINRRGMATGSIAVTDARGEFRFDSLANGDWTLTVDGPGVYGATDEPIRVGLGDELRNIKIAVRPAAKVSGQFTLTQSNAPCRAGSLQFVTEDLARRRSSSNPSPSGLSTYPVGNTAPPITARVDTRGEFLVDALPNGTYLLVARCDEHQLVKGPSSLHVDNKPVEGLQFSFSEGMTVTAHVHNDSGSPAALAEVRLSPADETAADDGRRALLHRRGLTDAQGSYRFGALTPGRYQVSARYSAINGQAFAEQTITLAGGSEDVHLTLPGTGTIRIHAQTQDGAAVSRILFFALDGKRARYEAKYRGDGRFEIGPLPRDSYRVFAYDNKNAKVPLQGGAAIPVFDPAGVDIEFRYDAPDASIRGRVVDHAGAPMPNTLVRAVSTTLDAEDELYSFVQTGMHGAQELLTDSNGHFRIDGLRPNATYDLYVDHPKGIKDVRRGIQTNRSVDISLAMTAELAGTVVNRSGKTVDRFAVIVESLENGTSRSQSFKDTSGRFKVENLLPGRLRLTIYDDSDADAEFERTLVLSPGATANIGTVTVASASQNTDP